MKHERLLDRIRILERNPDARFDEMGSADRIRAVREYLQRILNTRQGNSMIAQDFGMPDLTDLPSSMTGDRVTEIQRQIQELVRRFEPRMEKVNIQIRKAEEGSGMLRFQISGQLSEEEGSLPAVFEAEVEPGGKITVSG